MVEWVQAHLDVKTDTAKDLVFAARNFVWNERIYDRMLDRGATFDRTIAAVKLSDAGASRHEVVESYGRDLTGVGHDTVEALLCGGKAQVIGFDDGIPVVTSPVTRAIPPALRHHVVRRDSGCVIDGCHSRPTSTWSCAATPEERLRRSPQHAHRISKELALSVPA